MLYGSLYKVFKQLSKQKDKNGNSGQYDEIIIPKIFLKILLNDGKVPKIKKPIKITNKTSNKEDIININNFISEEIENISPKINPYFNFQKKKFRGITPKVKSHYINNPNISLPKIKFKKKITILTKKSEDLKNTEKQDFLISEAILNQMKKTYFHSPFHTSKELFKKKNSINQLRFKNNDNIEDNNYKRNSNTIKLENVSKYKKIFNKMSDDKKIDENDKDKGKDKGNDNCKEKDKKKDKEKKKEKDKIKDKDKDTDKDKEKDKEKDKDKDKNKDKDGEKKFHYFNKVNIISNNNTLALSRNEKEIENEQNKKNDNKNNDNKNNDNKNNDNKNNDNKNNDNNNDNNNNYRLIDNYNSLKNKSCSKLVKFIKNRWIMNEDINDNESKENNKIVKHNFEYNNKKDYNKFIINHDNFNMKNKVNKNNMKHIKIKKDFYNSSQLFRIKPKIKYKSKTMNFYTITISNNFKQSHYNLEYINSILNKKIIEFPLNNNISPRNEIFYYRVNKMYKNQFVKYMSHRLNWETIDNTNIINSEQKFANFEWRYYSNKLYYKNYKYDFSLPPKKLKMVNLFEKNYEIGNKKNMFINLINYCDKENINVFDIVPFTIIVNNSQYIEETLDIIQALIEFVEENKYRKGNLNSTKKYNELFWFDKNYDSLTNQYVNINKTFISSKNYWIIKPTDLYQGKCIEISNSYEEIVKKCRNIFKGVDKRQNPTQITNMNNIEELNNNDKLLTMDNAILEQGDKKNFISNIKKKIINSRMYCSNEIIIQKYLDNPLLYKKRKFDIRCFVLVDCNMNVFFCREGHLKGSSESYNLNNTNKFIHITNHSLQKKSNKFEMYELGNEMSYQDFKNFLVSENISLEKFDEMINQMRLLVKISFKAVANKLLKTENVLCFEIFGYDFILDNEFKLWILEINNNPGLGISSPLIKKLIPRMLDDAFRLTIDKVFNTRYSNECINVDGSYKSKYKLDGFGDDENIFEFLCNISS